MRSSLQNGNAALPEATARIEHKPHLNYAWQVQVFARHKNRFVVLEARKTEREALRILARLQADRARFGATK